MLARLQRRVGHVPSAYTYHVHQQRVCDGGVCDGSGGGSGGGGAVGAVTTNIKLISGVFLFFSFFFFFFSFFFLFFFLLPVTPEKNRRVWRCLAGVTA